MHVGSDSDTFLGHLYDANVLEETDDGSIRLTGKFRSLVSAKHDEIRDTGDFEPDGTLDRSRETGELEGGRASPAVLVRRAAGTDPRFVARLCAIHQLSTDIPFAELVHATNLVDLLERPGFPTDGIPDPFFPIHGDQLPVVLPLFRRSIVYVWRHDCDPCNLLQSDFEQVFEGDDRDFALFAVYGPDWAELLQREYDVHVGPTTLFVLEGDVDSRLVGAHPRRTLATEVEILRDE